MLTVVADGCPDREDGKDRSPPLIGEIVRETPRRMLAGALRAEVDARIAIFAAERGEAAQHRWRAVDAPHLAALVRAGAVFRDGVLAERPAQAAA